jgi:serine phosphatase RsbU (regulator of sigma subunit)/DNA-binding NarL/FixJ family response regulator
MTEPIRVMLVDDHAMVRRGLAAFLSSVDDLELVGEASGGLDALRVCEQAAPDVVLMDLVMPEMDGAAATRAIRQRCPQVQVVALTSYKEMDLVQSALEAGAIGYLLKNVSSDELADAIREAHAGRPTLAPEAAETLVLAERLERLGDAMLKAPPDASELPELLQEHVPGLFPDSRLEIRTLPGESLLRHPADWSGMAQPAWEWLRTSSEAHAFLPGAPLPWGGTQQVGGAIVLAPIISVGGPEAIGGIYVHTAVEAGTVENWLSAAQSLAARISSTLHGAQVYAQATAQKRVARELAAAARIQASFLPESLPDLPGWQLSAILQPARETSGDFYDVIPLPSDRLGIVVADVADKGMGAALYMALCRTLIRTHAAEYDDRPDLVLGATNRRLLLDARAGLFVTAFFCILEPATGRVFYCNAGHNPPYVVHAQGGGAQALRPTGIALGMLDAWEWTQETVELGPGDLLLVYTDGVTEAKDPRGGFFGPQRLVESARAHLGQPAHVVQEALLADVRNFVGGAPQFDDITLMLAHREGQTGDPRVGIDRRGGR